MGSNCDECSEKEGCNEESCITMDELEYVEDSEGVACSFAEEKEVEVCHVKGYLQVDQDCNAYCNEDMAHTRGGW